MDRVMEDKIQTKAFFVAGIKAWFRDAADPLALSAVEDAKVLLNSFPPDLEKPSIFAGTTADPSTILSFLWIAGEGGLKSTYISCKGNGLFSASWRDPDGTEIKEKSISLDALITRNIPAKITHWRLHTL